MRAWTREQIERVLSERAWSYTLRDIQNGVQFVLDDGACVNCYSTGKVAFGGKDTVAGRELRQLLSGSVPTSPPTQTNANPVPVRQSAVPSRVFIVYGHDAGAREQLELILRRLKLEPVVLQNLPAAGDTIIEKLENLTGADFACVLLTPDDEGYPRDLVGQKKFRARQNVVLELGMVLARLGRKHVAVLVKDEGLERPSDIEGIIYLPFKSHVDEVKLKLANHLQLAGFNIRIQDLLP